MKLPEELVLDKSHTAPIVQIDDDKIVLKLIKRFHEKSQIKNPYLSFERGQEFLDYINEQKNKSLELPLLVLIDINMPEMDGFEVLEKLRSDDYFKDVPICSMLTTSKYAADKDRAKSLGANTYIVKPDNAKEYIDFFKAIEQRTQS